MCDITNPLYGEHGASYVFAPQKGANKNLVKKLDKNLILLSNIIKEKLNIDVSSVEGSGAAGGMGAGIIAFFGGKLTSGINTILDLFDFDSKIKDADFIFTGEGKIDSQSVDGKVISGIATRAKRQNVPVIALCGAIGDVPDKVYDMGVTTIMSINQQAMDFKESKAYSKENLEAQMDHIIRLIKISKENNMKIFVRAQDLGKKDAPTLAKEIKALGFDGLQLAINKAIEGETAWPGELSEARAKEIAKTFLDEGLEIPLIGSYFNPVHSNKELVKRNISKFKMHLDYSHFSIQNILVVKPDHIMMINGLIIL